MLLRVNPDLRGLLGALLAMALGQSLIVVVSAWTIQHLFDRLSGKHVMVSLTTTQLLGLFLGTATIAFLLEVGKRRLASEIGLRHAASLRNGLFRKFIQEPSLRAQKRDKGTLLLPFVGDLTASRRWFGEGLARGLAALVLVPVLLSLIAARSGEIALALASVLALSVIGSLALSGPLNRAVREVRRRRGGLTAFIAGRLDAATTIKVNGRTRRELRKVQTRTDLLSAAERRRAWVIGLMRGQAHLTHSLMVLVTLVVGSRVIAAGHATPGTIVGVLSLVGLLAGGVTDFARAFELWHPATIAEGRLNRILMANPRNRRAASKKSPRGAGPNDMAIVSLSLPPTLRSITATASRGDRVLIDGPSGEGKSALLAAAAGLVPPASGAVHFGSAEVSSMGEAGRRQLIGFASGDGAILPGSLAMNIAYRGTTATADIAPLASGCGLSSLIDRLSGGLNGRLTPETPMSDAERHGIVLARALFNEPPLLLLDSIDTHLPPATLTWLGELIRGYPGVVLMVAARDELRATASRRWLLNEGKLAEVPLELTRALPDPEGRVVPFERPSP